MDHSQQAANLFNKLANSYQDKFMDVSLYAESLDFFCDHLDSTNPSILELACGPGNITKYILGKRSDLFITGTDLAPKMLELAKINNPGSEFMTMDCRVLSSLTKTYDGIICGFGLPYLSKKEALKWIADVSEKLNPGGLLYISTMEDDNSRSAYKKGSTGDEIFMNYHEEGYLKAGMTENHLRVIMTDRKSYIHNGEQVTDMIIIAEKCADQ
ncbi:MAG TPA: class I SAM-dependent methyltransferase [Bacteroidia bacterium]|jgi:ubiquinone/menaquinone biosynthesis C-methylase UbiE